MKENKEYIKVLYTSAFVCMLTALAFSLAADAFAPAALIVLSAALLAAALRNSFARLQNAPGPSEPSQLRFDNSVKGLDALHEAICVMDADGRILLSNSSMFNILRFRSAGEEYVNICDTTVSPVILDYIRKQKCVRDSLINLNGYNVMLSGTPYERGDGSMGYAMIMHDITEILRLRETFSSTYSMIESLRICNHDFKNKLHIIVGYLESGRYDEAMQYIIGISRTPYEELSEIKKYIQIPRISALLIGRMLKAMELGITVKVLPSSDCVVLTSGISKDVYTTILGNLIENAVEELERCEQDIRTVYVEVFTSREFSVLTVSDNGGGIPPSILESILEMGSTSKTGEHRGFGLSIVKALADKYNGSVEVETDAESGTAITVNLYSE